MTQQVFLFSVLSTILTLIPYLGNVFIGEMSNHRVRKVTISTGIITTIAGTGSSSYSGDGGPATSAALYFPYGLALDAAGTTYVSGFF